MVRTFIKIACAFFIFCANSYADQPAPEYLSDHLYLALSTSQGWGQTGINSAAFEGKNKPQPLTIARKKYEKGLGLHANAEMLIYLGGRYERFEAQVGLQTGQKGSVIFQVWVNDKQVYDSGLMRENDPAKSVSIDLKGANEMTLKVTDGGDGITCDAANWGDAKLIPAKERKQNQKAIDIGRFGQMITNDSERMDGAHNDRTDSFPTCELFIDKELFPDKQGLYEVKTSNGVACVGLMWLERRHLVSVGLELADSTAVIDLAKVQVQQWVMAKRGASPGGSRWQGRWVPLEGTTRKDGARLIHDIDLKNYTCRQEGNMKIRWLIPSGAETVKVRRLEAFTNSSWTTANLQLVMETPEAGKVASITAYNGEFVDNQGVTTSCDWNLAQPLNVTVRYSKERPWMADRTILRLRLPDGEGFGVAIDDVLTSGPVYVKDFGIFVALAKGASSVADYKKKTASQKTILERVRQMPDQSFAQAVATMHRPEADEGPTMLSLANENHKFIFHRDGSLVFDFDPKVVDIVDTSYLALYGTSLYNSFTNTLRPTFGTGKIEGLTRQMDEGGWIPIPVIRMSEEGVVYQQRTYVAPYDKAGAPRGMGKWMNKKPLGVMEFTIENPTKEERNVSIKLELQHATKAPKYELLPIQTIGQRSLWMDGATPLGAVGVIQGEGLTQAIKDNIWILSGRLRAGKKATASVYIPGWNVSTEELATLTPKRDLAKATRDYWVDLIADGTQIDIPDAQFKNIIYGNIAHCMIAAHNHDGVTIAPWISSWNYGPLESEAHSIIRGMQYLGQMDFARRSLDYFIGKYNPEGYLTTGYTAMGTRWHLWTLGEYFKLTQDKEWLQANAPEVARVCNWIMAQRAKTMVKNSLGENVPEYGLIPPGVMADWEVYAYYFYLNGYYYAGLKGAADGLKALGWPGADKMEASAADHKTNILRAFKYVQAMAPVLPLKDGNWVPEYPTHVFAPSPITHYYKGEDVGRSGAYDVELGAHHLIPFGVMDPKSADARWMMNHMEDVQFLIEGWNYYPAKDSEKDWFNRGGFAKVQPYYARTTEVYALQDDVKPFIRSYFNSVVSLLNREDHSLWEHFMNGAFNKTHETGYFLYQTRLMLLEERGNELWLAPFVTNQWFKDGQTVGVSKAPSEFGEVSYQITSHVAKGYIEAGIKPPTRQSPEKIVLRLRHPEGLKMKSVKVNGHRTKNFDAEKEIISIKPTKKKITVVAEY